MLKVAILMNKKQEQHKSKSDDLPEKITESYGTYVKHLPGYNVGESSRQEYTERSPEFPAEFTITDDELDTYWQETVGDEAVGGTVATPEKNVTEEFAKAVGLEMNDDAFFCTNEILEHRDEARWELDPTSAEDYQERRE